MIRFKSELTTRDMIESWLEFFSCQTEDELESVIKEKIATEVAELLHLIGMTNSELSKPLNSVYGAE